MKETKLLKNLKLSGWKKKRFSRKFIFQWLKHKKLLKNLKLSGWKKKSCRKILNPAVEGKKVWKILNPAVERKKRFSRKIVFQWLKDKKLLKNLKPSGWKQKSCWKILNSPVERKKLLKILKPSTILALERILNLRKKGAFLIFRLHRV